MNEVMTAVVPDMKCRVVSDPAVARRLIKDGFRVVDIKPKKNFVRETTFVFEVTDGFYDKMNMYVEERKQLNEAK